MESRNATSEAKMLDTLRRYWGYDTFRPMQQHAIESVLAGHDTLVLMPTGAGKSIIYQLPTLMREGLCIVVTPLIALMKDQVDRLRRRSIAAAMVHSGLSPRQIDITLDNCVYGDIKFLYLAPERLASEALRLRLQKMNVSLLAVDEAHCISQWGYDFRPSYLRIAEIRRMIPDTPVLALTASATQTVAEDIMDKLRFGSRTILRSSFARSNLQYAVRHVDDKDNQLLRIVNNVAGTGIVYVRTREGAERVSEMLNGNGIKADFYHGGLGHAEREMRQNDWIGGRTRVIVATNAFGMGIDKADVRFVVHYSMCDSLEEYYQEAGRAGRDGQRAYAVLLVSPDDRGRIERRIESEFPSIETIKRCYEAVCNYLQVAIGDGAGATFSFNIHDFCRRYTIYHGTAVNVFKLLQQNGYMTLTDEMENPSRILFCVSRDDLYRIRVERNDLDLLIRTILRLYDRVFNEFRPIDEGEIAAASGYTPERVHELLKKLWQMHIIRYIPSNRSPLLYFDEERLPVEDLHIAPETYQRRKHMSLERYEGMLRYAFNDTTCRSRMLEEYFGGADAKDCGICDVCLERRRGNSTSTAASFTGTKPDGSTTTPAPDTAITSAGPHFGSNTDTQHIPAAGSPTTAPANRQQLLEEIRRHPHPDIRQVASRFACDPKTVIRMIDELLADGKISIDTSGFITINR